MEAEYNETAPVKFHILLVDDSEGEARLFTESLRQAAPRVNLYWVATAAEGLEFLNRQNRFQDVGQADIVVCDLNMPGMSGFDFLKRVKGDSMLKRLPVIMYSGSSHARDVEICYTLGANAYLVKAMTPEGMVEQLKTLVHFWLESAKLPTALAGMD